jgi:hypothetical protein
MDIREWEKLAHTQKIFLRHPFSHVGDFLSNAEEDLEFSLLYL